MTASLTDRSSYYKGLLILVGRDRIIDPRERELMLRIGRILDFDPRFCDAAMNDLLSNRYIKSEALNFSQPLLAESFLRDAIRLALVDERLDPRELNWLRKVAHANSLSDDWLDDAILLATEHGPVDPSTPLEFQKHL